MLGKFVSVRGDLRGAYADYAARRTDRHGWLYKVTRVSNNGTLLECKSIATGAVATLIHDMVQEYADAVQEPSGS